MKQIFCPDMAIVENKDTTVSQLCTIYTNDESVVTLIKPLKYPEIGGDIVKDTYYIKNDTLVKAITTEKVTATTVTTKIADVKPVDVKPPSWMDKMNYKTGTELLYKELVYVVLVDHLSDKAKTPDITSEWYKLR